MQRWLAAVLSVCVLAVVVASVPRSGQVTAQEAQQQKRKAQRKNAEPQAARFSEAPQTAEQGGAPVLSAGDSYDDFPSIAQGPDGALYAAYAAYYDGHDQIRLHRRLPNGGWSTYTPVPLGEARADVWMPQLAVDAKNRVWVIWCEQTGQSPGVSGNWDLYARSLDGTTWGDLVRLTDDPRPDINPHVVTDEKRRITIVWQGHPQNNGDVLLCRFDGEAWSKPAAVTTGEASDWYPRAAVDSKGTTWIGFDSYRNGDYDVFLTSWDGEKAGEVIPIAASDYYEAHASVACDKLGSVWIAWEQGGWNWGKDQGYWLTRDNRRPGSTLGSARTVHVARWAEGELREAPEVTTSLPHDNLRGVTALPGLLVDSEDRLWLRFRQHLRFQRGVRVSSFWADYVTSLGVEGWAPAAQLPGSAGRISVFNREIVAQDGSLIAAVAGDQRAPANFHQPVRDRVAVATVAKAAAAAGSPKLLPFTPPAEPNRRKWDPAQEAAQVAAIRAHRAEIGGKPHRILRGDLHRHTELSWDVGPGNDGSYLDFYRYMIDVAAMDFGSLTDHQGGGHYAYHWWLTEKSADLYHLPPKFVPLYGYERSVRYPHGHRNIFHAQRGVPVFPFQLKTTQSGVFPGVGTGEVVDNDTKLLYEYLRKTNGVAISHTSGTSSMGTDWRDNDPAIEPVVEIYQGARNSYEALGAPRVHSEAEPPNEAPGGFQKEGMLWNAYTKGYRLGITASSDHGSTHISYSMVYVPVEHAARVPPDADDTQGVNTRQPILDAIRARHTYGATDNLIVDLACSEHFMGDEFKIEGKPTLKLKVQGTAPIEEIVLVRNNRYLHTFKPEMNIEGKLSEFTYTDMTPDADLNLYYVRVKQQNGELAWSSPLWVHAP